MSEPAKEKNIAVIQLRGTISVQTKLKDTLKMLNLKKKNSCTIVPNTPNFIGMVKKVGHLVTWGELEEDVEKELKKKNKEGPIHLHPPLGGFERKGVKVPFTKGGTLGYRGREINILIKKMI